MRMQIKARLLAVGFVILVASLATPAWADRIRGALERFELPALRVLQISAPRKDGARFAYIEDAEHYAYRVEAGDYLGKKDGKILRITKTKIVVIEIVKDGDAYKESKVVLKCDEWCQKQ